MALEHFGLTTVPRRRSRQWSKRSRCKVLAQQMVDDPVDVLRRLVDLTLEICERRIRLGSAYSRQIRRQGFFVGTIYGAVLAKLEGADGAEAIQFQGMRCLDLSMFGIWSLWSRMCSGFPRLRRTSMLRLHPSLDAKKFSFEPRRSRSPSIRSKRAQVASSRAFGSTVENWLLIGCIASQQVVYSGRPHTERALAVTLPVREYRAARIVISDRKPRQAIPW